MSLKNPLVSQEPDVFSLWHYTSVTRYAVSSVWTRLSYGINGSWSPWVQPNLSWVGSQALVNMRFSIIPVYFLGGWGCPNTSLKEKNVLFFLLSFANLQAIEKLEPSCHLVISLVFPAMGEIRALLSFVSFGVDLVRGKNLSFPLGHGTSQRCTLLSFNVNTSVAPHCILCTVCGTQNPSQSPRFCLLLFPTQHSNNPATLAAWLCGKHTRYFTVCMLVCLMPSPNQAFLLGNICQLPRLSLVLPSNP